MILLTLLIRAGLKIRETWWDLGEIFEENKLSLFYLMLIYLNTCIYGISSKIFDSLIPDLQFIYNASYELVNYMWVPYYLGFMIGALVNYLHRWWNRQMLLVVFMFIICVTTALLPYYGYIYVGYAAMAFCGAGSGAWEAGNSAWLIEVWPARVAILLHADQFVYNLGMALAPLLSGPFTFEDALFDEDNGNRSITIADRKDHLLIPLMINAYVQSIIPFIFLALYFINRYQKRPLSKKIHNHNIDVFLPENPVSSSRRLKLFLCFTWLTVYYTAELAYYNFRAAWLEGIGTLAEDEAAFAGNLFTISYTLGPLISAFLTPKVAANNLITGCYFLTFASVLLLSFGYQSPHLVYLGNFTLGLGYSPILPAILAYTEVHLGMNERNVSIYTLLIGLSWLISVVEEPIFSLLPMAMMYYQAVFLPLSLSCYLFIRYWLYRNSRSVKFYMEKRMSQMVVMA